MTRFKLTRRGFLRAAGLGAGALSLPLLGAGRSRAAGEFPLRFLVVFTANGTIPENWRPGGGETDFTLGRILEPLARHREKLLILDGMDMRSATSGPGDGHQQGMGHFLTGVELLPGDTMGGCDSCAPVSWASGISIDQHIASFIGPDTRFRSLELGVKTSDNANVWTRMCYRAASEPLPPEPNPYAVFDRVFGDFDTSRFDTEKRDYLRRQVVDFVYEDFAAVRGRLGADDRRRLESHVQGMDEIARRLDNPTELGAACVAPDLGARLDHRRDENYPAVGELQMRQAAMALACDLTRVVSLQWSNSVSGQRMPWLGIGEGHHDLSHEGDGNTDAKTKLTEINRWYAEQLAFLLDRLDEIPEGDGTLLDNTIVLWGNELGVGNSHTRNNIPIVMAGSGGGALRTGRALRYDVRPHNDLYATLQQVYGIDQSTFGDPRFNTGTMPELLS
jgi:hypothetical protein